MNATPEEQKFLTQGIGSIDSEFGIAQESCKEVYEPVMEVINNLRSVEATAIKKGLLTPLSER